MKKELVVEVSGGVVVDVYYEDEKGFLVSRPEYRLLDHDNEEEE